MTDPGPFAPPSGALPPRPAEPTPAPSPATPPLPPPTGAPIQATPYASPVGPLYVPPPPPRRRWLLPVIIGGSLGAVALVAGVAFVAVQLAGVASLTPYTGSDGGGGQADAPSAPEELVSGEPGSPVAADPLDCAMCFTVVEARALGLPDESYAALGLAGDNLPAEALAGVAQGDDSTWWRSDGGTPDSCFFTYSRAPLSFEPGDITDSAAANDSVVYSEWYTDDAQSHAAGEAVRVFDDSASAVAHLAALEAAVAGCPDYSQPDSGWSARVTAAPAFDLPPSVAAYGWVESGGPSRFYGAELQRGNLVARVTLWSAGDGPTEEEFRDLVEEYAALLAAVEPAS